MRLGLRGIGELFTLPDADLFLTHTRVMLDGGYQRRE